MSLSRNKKRLVWSRDNYICQICFTKCTTEEVSVDHIFAQKFGGSNEMNNLRTAHKKCNQEKDRNEQVLIYKK